MATRRNGTGAASRRARGAPKPRRRRRAERRARWLWRIGGYVTFLAIWQFASTFLVEDFIVPPPAAIAEAIVGHRHLRRVAHALRARR